jgi:tetratricopeptide (TPR) repeat protein
MRWLQYTAGAQLDLAKLLLVEGSVEEAAAKTRAGCELTGRLAAKDRTNIEFRKLATDCLTGRAEVAMASGAHGEAVAMANRALATAQALDTGDPIDDRLVVARNYKLLGDAYRRGGNLPAAKSAWQTALAAWPKNVDENPRQLAIKAELLKSLGRPAEARPLTRRLSEMGYRQLL